MRMWQGALGFADEDGVVIPAYTVATPHDDRIDARYASHVLKTPRLIFDFERFSQGLTSDTWTLRFGAFGRVPITLPPLTEQKKIAGILDSARAEIALLDRKIELLRTQKRGLAQKLLSGEVSVGDVDG